MKTTRRGFFKSSALLSAAALVSPRLAFARSSGAFFFPGETHLHTRTWMAFPDSTAIWGRSLLGGLQKDIANIANNIANFEPVFLIANPASVAKAKRMVGAAVTVIPMALDDCWMRDSGPVFRISGAGGLDCLGLNFNGWGNRQTHTKDALVARNVADYLGLPFTAASFVSEGGAIATDGVGTLISTESSIVNKNRNPGKTRAQLEAEILAAMGATKYIWFAGVRNHDITDDHVDGVSLFSAPGQALVEAPFPGDTSIWAADQENQAAVLAASTDARGQAIAVTRVGDPDYNKLPREVDYAGYANMYPVNGGVLMIQTGNTATDAAAAAVAASAFPGRAVVQLPLPSLDQGGGGIHCVTQQQPVP